MGYQALIFDCYGVLYESVGRIWFGAHAKGLHWRDAETRYCHPLDRGEMADDEFFGSIAALSGEDVPRVRQEWLDLINPDEETLALARELKGRYKLAVCSNAGSWYFRQTLERSGATEIFDPIVVSSELRIAKPDPRMYAHMLGLLGTAPETTVFIDDAPRNVEGAEKAGMRGILFTGAEALRKDLAALGVV